MKPIKRVRGRYLVVKCVCGGMLYNLPAHLKPGRMIRCRHCGAGLPLASSS